MVLPPVGLSSANIVRSNHWVPADNRVCARINGKQFQANAGSEAGILLAAAHKRGLRLMQRQIKRCARFVKGHYDRTTSVSSV